jgi:hypothetical protein
VINVIIFKNMNRDFLLILVQKLSKFSVLNLLLWVWLLWNMENFSDQEKNYENYSFNLITIGVQKMHFWKPKRIAWMGKLMSETTKNELSNVTKINRIIFWHNSSYLVAYPTHLKIGFKEVGSKMDSPSSEYDH